MSLISFMIYKKEDKSILASRKYGEKTVNPEELEKPLLATKIPTSVERDYKSQKIGIIGTGRKSLVKVLFADKDEENKSL